MSKVEAIAKAPNTSVLSGYTQEELAKIVERKEKQDRKRVSYNEYRRVETQLYLLKAKAQGIKVSKEEVEKAMALVKRRK